MSTPETQQRVHRVVATSSGPVTSKHVAGELAITTGWACAVLAELVAAGKITVANAGGGTYEWTVR